MLATKASTLKLSTNISLCIKEMGFNFFTAVPCGTLNKLLKSLSTDFKKNQFYFLPREDLCLGVACGVYFGGLKPLVLMQNSGFAQSVNALASLIIPFKIPLTIIISVRGAEGLDSEENLVMGKTTSSLLTLLEIPFKTMQQNNFSQVISWATTVNDKKKSPAAILIEPKLFGWDVKQ